MCCWAVSASRLSLLWVYCFVFFIDLNAIWCWKKSIRIHDNIYALSQIGSNIINKSLRWPASKRRSLKQKLNHILCKVQNHFNVVCHAMLFSFRFISFYQHPVGVVVFNDTFFLLLRLATLFIRRLFVIPSPKLNVFSFSQIHHYSFRLNIWHDYVLR